MRATQERLGAPHGARESPNRDQTAQAQAFVYKNRAENKYLHNTVDLPIKNIRREFGVVHHKAQPLSSEAENVSIF